MFKVEDGVVALTRIAGEQTIQTQTKLLSTGNVVFDFARNGMIAEGVGSILKQRCFLDINGDLSGASRAKLIGNSVFKGLSANESSVRRVDQLAIHNLNLTVGGVSDSSRWRGHRHQYRCHWPRHRW